MKKFLCRKELLYERYDYTFSMLFHHCTVEQIENQVRLKLPWNVFLAGTTAGRSRMTDCSTGKQYLLTKGGWWLIPKNCEVFYDLRFEQEILNIQFSLEYFPGMDLFEKDNAIHTGKDPGLVAALHAELLKTENIFSMLKVRSMMTTLAAGLKPEQNGEIRLDHPFVGQLQFLLKNLSAADSVKTIAFGMQMTPEAFSRKFHQIFHCPPKKFFDMLLANRAIEYLHSGRNSSETAAELHFSSVFHFSRFIRRMTGKNITEFRRWDPQEINKD